MRFDELDLTSATWTIPGAKTKNLQEQVIPLGPTEIEVLRDRRKLLRASKIISPYVFPGDGKTGHVRDRKRSWTTLRGDLGIIDLTIHDLRRSLAAAMASLNVNVALIRGALNHRDMKQPYTYTHELIRGLSLRLSNWLTHYGSKLLSNHQKPGRLSDLKRLGNNMATWY